MTGHVTARRDDGAGADPAPGVSFPRGGHCGGAGDLRTSGSAREVGGGGYAGADWLPVGVVHGAVFR